MISIVIPDWVQYVFYALLAYSFLEILLSYILKGIDVYRKGLTKSETSSGVVNSTVIPVKGYKITRDFFNFLDYDVAEAEISELVDLYLNDDVEPYVREGYLVYLLILIARNSCDRRKGHVTSTNCYKKYFINLYSEAIERYNFDLSLIELANYKIGNFFYNDIITANIWIKDIDCVSFDEYKRLCNFLDNDLSKYLIDTKNRTKFIRICLVSNVLLNSRFTRSYKVYNLPGNLNIIFMEIYILYFVAYMKGNESRNFKTMITLDSYSYLELKSLYKKYASNLSAFYKKYDISSSLVGHVFLDCNMISKIKAMASNERQLFLHDRGWYKGDDTEKSGKMDVTNILDNYGRQIYHSPEEKRPTIELNTLQRGR